MENNKDNNEKAIYYYKKGVEVGNKGDVKKALEYFNKAIELNPFYRDAYYNKALALRILGRYEEARECLIIGLSIERYINCNIKKK
ncbi:TPR repeat-containing protein [Methanocaldococcus lauensis]|uniref:TPR repeat-containing protein n=1 Tax=Methanocaldococcus lauensis TaxID=2546128 RepID=A0A8D6PX50_9EURY|nr:tetratricopeptide repeat protein [Methanocaldococcus lauensis]CAB3288760.1 TPR repeat-containing protein [Methanocaldococcus lauensis]CAB3289055.1 TPR repeat-containing protein [Methanocaldococcus lauensis]